MAGIQRRQAFEAYRRARAERLAKLTPLSARAKVAQLGMEGFLQFWSVQVVGRLQRATFPPDEPQRRVVREGTLLRSPAGDQSIDDWQRRFGLETPPSLRAVYGCLEPRVSA